jgi:hypothetical protein
MITEIEFVLEIFHDDADVGCATVIILRSLASSLCTDTRAESLKLRCLRRPRTLSAKHCSRISLQSAST